MRFREKSGLKTVCPLRLDSFQPDRNVTHVDSAARVSTKPIDQFVYLAHQFVTWRLTVRALEMDAAL